MLFNFFISMPLRRNENLSQPCRCPSNENNVFFLPSLIASFLLLLWLFPHPPTLLCLSTPTEQQPRIRGWLMASLDGQTTGLVPANYVKVLGKRRGRRHAELERLAQQQQQAPQPGLASASGSNSTTVLPPTCPEEMLESVFLETPGQCPPPSGTVVMPSEKMDLL